MSAFAGETISSPNVGADQNTQPGTWTALFGDIALVSADGTVRPLYNGQTAMSLGSWGTNNSDRNSTIRFLTGVGWYPLATTNYYHQDHLGSSRLMTGYGGWPVWSGTFRPFGGEVNAEITVNNFKFTGKERDSESNLDNSIARYFSSQQGRFMSPDPGPWIFLNPQSYNAYSYALDNPLRYTDDGGETAQDRVNAANNFAGQNIPYLYGGKDPSCGLDCSGLVQNVFAADPDNTISGLDNVLSAAGQSSILQSQGYYSSDTNNAEPGDAIFFSDSNGHIVHTGIVVSIKDGKLYFVHAPHPGPNQNVKKTYVSIKSKMFGAEKFAGVGRPIEPNPLNPNSNQNQNPNGTSSFWDTINNWFESFFFNQTPQLPPQTSVTSGLCSDYGGDEPPCTD